MGYFPNGDSGMFYENMYCLRCVHSKYDEPEGMCAVMLIHNLWNYEFCNDRDSPAAQMMDFLIPRPEGQLENEQCSMFYERPGSLDPGAAVRDMFA